MNKQESIEKLEYLKRLLEEGSKDSYNNGFINALKYTLNIVKQLDEPEKPKVPQFVADWLEVCKDNLPLSLANSMNNIVMRSSNQPDKTIHWLAKNSETFAKAWIYGYEVEKEKLYTVKIPNPNLNAHAILQKTKEGIVLVLVGNARWKGCKSSKLTEAEIKQDFDWAFRWAKEVEE